MFSKKKRDKWTNIHGLVGDVFSTYRNRFITMDSLVDHVLARSEEFDKGILQDKKQMEKLALGHGLRGAIQSAILRMRKKFLPILSSPTKGKGYIYLTQAHPNVHAIIQDKFVSQYKRRVQIPRSEFQTDSKISLSIYHKITDPIKKKKLKKVLVEYGVIKQMV